jgi:hypothetical protein
MGEQPEPDHRMDLITSRERADLAHHRVRRESAGQILGIEAELQEQPLSVVCALARRTVAT